MTKQEIAQAKAAIQWMTEHAGEHVGGGAEVNTTLLAEDYAAFADHLEWLDDPEHDLWDWAYIAAVKWEEREAAPF